SLSADQFPCYFLEALHGSGLPSFRRKYRDVQLLVIDDVQFFAGKKATLVELQHTVDALLREGKQLVFTADRPPAELTALGDELINRFSGGLACEVKRPEYATRQKIVRQLAVEKGLELSEEVIQLIAREILGDVRQISGALNRLRIVSRAHSGPIGLEEAGQILSDLFASVCKVVRLHDIETAICEVFGMQAETLQANKRTKEVSHPRMLAMWLARKYTRSGLVEIGEYFGKKSHSTVISSQRKISQWLETGKRLQISHKECPLEEVVRRVENELKIL
ncbi:MAG: DnaA/Hda family protein, partial [Pirellulaceae bacterium]|nr:DnaA/Hda family protein [Pirellulaceae bacterium]